MQPLSGIRGMLITIAEVFDGLKGFPGPSGFPSQERSIMTR